MEYKLRNETGQIKRKKVCMEEMGFGVDKQDKNGGDSSEWMGWQQEWICFIFILWTSVQHSYLLLVYHLGG